MLNKDMPISSWCCFNKGHMNLSLATDTDSYLPGEAIRVNAQVKLTAQLQGLARSWDHSDTAARLRST